MERSENATPLNCTASSVHLSGTLTRAALAANHGPDDASSRDAASGDAAPEAAASSVGK